MKALLAGAVLALVVWAVLDHWAEERNARFSEIPTWAKG